MKNQFVFVAPFLCHEVRTSVGRNHQGDFIPRFLRSAGNDGSYEMSMEFPGSLNRW